MKNGVYNISISGVSLQGMESTDDAVLEVARMIIRMHENEDDLSALEPAFEVVEEFDPEYETEEEELDELDFEQAS